MSSTNTHRQQAELLNDMLQPYLMAGRTSVECPDWCELPQPHGFDSIGAVHTRSHHENIDTGLTQDGLIEELGMQIVVDEERDGTDDSTVRSAPPRLYLMVEGELSVDQARKLATAILSATQKMQELER